MNGSKQIILRLPTIPLVFIIHLAFSQPVGLEYTSTSVQAVYAAQVIKKALLQKGYSVEPVGAGFRLVLVLDTTGLQPEGYAITRIPGKMIRITGYDGRGLIYGSYAFSEKIADGVPFDRIKNERGRPALPFRAIKFDLPWDTYRHSLALDLHDATCRDTTFWKAFLDMMAENRFNTLTLWNLHPYPYMIRPWHFPEATPFDDQELADWQRLFKAIFRMAKERGIDTYLVPFNIFVSPSFAKAHHVEMDNLQHDYFVNGDTSEIIKRYTRECVTQVLQEYPDLTGFGLTLGEGMGGMTPQEREDWIRETIIEGMRLAGRKSKLIHRIPFSSGTGSLGNTSLETEKLTRKAIEEEAGMGFLEGAIWADIKFNWSHGYSTTRLVKVHGGKLFDGYTNPKPDHYKLVWTVRNEDFFCLRWGSADFIRNHIIANSNSDVGGYMIGSETYIPAKDYFTALKGSVSWQYAFQRQWLFYRIWGRMLYDPHIPDTVFRDAFVRKYGQKASPLFDAYNRISSVPIDLAASFDFTWDFTLYSEGFLSLDQKTKNVNYISIDRQIEQPTADPDYISVHDYVKAKAAHQRIGNKITPLLEADKMESDARAVLRSMSNMKDDGDLSLMYEIADVKIWSYLGLYFAEKWRGAVALQTFRIQGVEPDKQHAILHLQKALVYWDSVVAISRPIYKDMPLTHYSEPNGSHAGGHDDPLFHWEKIRPDVAHDIDIARAAKKE